MKLLMIAWGYLPNQFSESLCNAKLVLALQNAGHSVDVISHEDFGNSYGRQWEEPWSVLENTTYVVSYKRGNFISRAADVVWSGAVMDGDFSAGVRWARRAYQQACKMLDTCHYDAVLTRSPNDIAHTVGAKLKKRFRDMLWIANWNDPADPIWPGQYKHNNTPGRQNKLERRTESLLKSTDINTFPSQSLLEHFTNHFPFLANRRTAVIPHVGFLEYLFPHLDPDVATSKLMMLHSGNLSAERNPDTTFRAMRKMIDSGCSDFELHILGAVNDFTENLIAKYNLSDHVKCIGSLPYMSALKKLNSYDVLVLLEAILDRGIFFASKFTDYAQTGKPILAISPAEGFARDMLAAHGGGIHADNTSPEAIAQALSTLIRLKKEGRLSSISSSALYSNFAPAAVVATYENLCSK